MDLLSNEHRVVKDLPPPPHRPLSDDLLYPIALKGKPDWRILKDHLYREGRLDKAHVLKLIFQTVQILKNEGNVLYVDDPLTVVGDIHGQFYDLMKVLQLGADPDISKYVFLGDFVDRGSFSVEVICLLYAMKVHYPTRVFLLRGNHECRQLTSLFNFRDECRHKFDQEIYEAIMDSFDYLPLVAIINGKFLCIHGGISPEFITPQSVENLDRFKEPPKAGLFCDILWADPVENEDAYSAIQFRSNEVRGCSWFFGQRAVLPILEQNNFLSIIRAHEAQFEGYKLYNYSDQTKEFPQVMTIFSAPNYCDFYNNKAAILRFENNTLNIQQFVHSQHPYLLPHFLDIFSWSIPFVSEKVTEMLHHILQPKPGEDEDSGDDQKVIQRIQTITQEEKKKRIYYYQNIDSVSSTRNKIKFISKMMKMQTTLRQERENIIKLKGLCPDNRIPKGVLIQGSEGIKNALERFNNVKAADQINEKRPDNDIIE